MRVCILALVLTGCASVPPQFEERHLGTIPEDAKITVPVVFSANGARAAWVERRPETSRMIHGDKPGKTYGFICCSVISPDGSRVAYVAGQDGKQIILLDGEVFDDYGPDWTVNWAPVFSTTAKVVAVRLTSTTQAKSCVGVDGRRGKYFDRVGPPVMSRNGARVAYRAHLGERCFVVVDGVRGPEYEFMSDPAISADGKVVAYGAKGKEGWVLVVGDKKTPLDHKPSYVFLSADGRRVGYTRPDGEARVRVVVDGKPGEPYTLVGLPVFSRDGKRVAYAADEGDKQFVVVDEQKIAVTGRESDPVFSPDGSQVGYGSRIGREIWWKIVDAP